MHWKSLGLTEVCQTEVCQTWKKKRGVKKKKKKSLRFAVFILHTLCT